jgi:hypothetical protein
MFFNLQALHLRQGFFHNLFLDICLLIKYVFVFLMKVIAYLYFINVGWVLYKYSSDNMHLSLCVSVCVCVCIYIYIYI